MIISIRKYKLESIKRTDIIKCLNKNSSDSVLDTLMSTVYVIENYILKSRKYALPGFWVEVVGDVEELASVEDDPELWKIRRYAEVIIIN